MQQRIIDGGEGMKCCTWKFSCGVGRGSSAMRYFLASFLLSLGGYASADTVGPAAQMTWDYPDPMPAHVDGFNLYCNGGAPVWSGTEKLIAIPLSQGGDYSCYVTAFNAVGESEASNTLNFTYVITAPDAPTVLRFAN